METYGKQPLSFERNPDKAGAPAQFLARGLGYTAILTPSEAVLALTTAAVHMKLTGANPESAGRGLEPMPGSVNYLIGNDPQQWRTNLRTFARVKYSEVYPGVDVIYYGNQRQLEYDLLVAPGADPGAVRLNIQAGGSIRLNPGGDLVLDTTAGSVRLQKPVAYQPTADGRKFIEARYRLHGRHEVTFEIAGYDHARPLVIDPTLAYATYLGGKAGENDATLAEGFLSGIAVDSAGSAYVTGFTASTDFPTAHPFQVANGGGGYDVFVAKLTPDGSGLVYSTYLGGSGRELGGGIAVDSNGNAYVAGQTTSTDFPTTPGAFQLTSKFVTNAFVTKLNASGSGLAYSTYLGGSNGADFALGIAVNSSGQACVAGEANSTDFPTTAGAPQRSQGGLGDAFASVLTADGSALAFSTYLGGRGADFGAAIAVDAAGNIYVTGSTLSSNFPTVNPIQAAGSGGEDAWVAKLNPAASALVYATYLGGGGLDRGHGIAVDSAGNAYVTGVTNSTNFPTVNPYQAVNGGTEDVFVTKLNPAGSALVYSTYLGGSGSDQGIGIAVDFAGSAYVTGITSSRNFPTVNSLQPFRTAFVTKFSADGSVLSYSTFLGGSSSDNSTGIAVGLSCNAYVTGATNSIDFPTTPGAAQTTLGGAFDAFVAEISEPSGGIVATSTTVTSSANPAVFGQQIVFSATVRPAACAGAVPTGTVTFFDGAATLGTVSPLTNGIAQIAVSGLSVGSHPITAAYGGDANFSASSSLVLVENVNAGVNPPTISKVFSTATILQGGSTSLSFTISNPNTTTALTGVGFGDTLPAGLIVAIPNGQSGSCSGGGISAVAGSSTVSLAGATLAAGATCSFSVNVTGTAAGLLINTTAPVTSTNGGSGNQATASLTVLPSLVMISVSESIKVTDTPLVPSMFINVSEAIKVADAPATYNTPSGSNIVAQPVDTTAGTSPVKLTFTNVTQPGVTSLTTSSGGPPPPSGFQLGSPAVYYNLTTTAVYTGPIQICINYAGISFQTAPGPRLFHFQSGNWADVTTSVDTINTIVCGSSSSLSPFGLFQSAQSGGISTTTSITAPGVAYGAPAVATVSVGSSSGSPTGSVSLVVDGGAASTMPLSAGSATFNLGILSAGSHSLDASFAAQGNFLASLAAGTQSVAQAPLTIAANNVSRPYGSNNPALTGSIAGLQNGDPITASFATAAAPASPVGAYPITSVVLDPQNRLRNYRVTLVSGIFTVVPAATRLSVATSPSSIRVGQSTTITVTLTAPDMVIPIDHAVLAPLTVSSPVVSDILTNNGVCTPVAGAVPGIATCTMTLTAVEPNGRTLDASFPGSSALLANTGTSNLIVTAPLESKVSCVSSDFRSVRVPGGSYLWLNSIFKVRDVNEQRVTITFFHSSVQFQYMDDTNNLVQVNQPMPDAKIVIDPSVTSASTTFDAVDNVWITTISFDLDDNTFLTGMPWLVPAGGIPGDIEPVTWCGTFASDTPGVDIGWRWAAAAYSSFSVDVNALGVKPMYSDHDNPSTNQDPAGTPEHFKAFVIPGARGKGGTNYTGSYTGSANIE